MIAYIVIAVLLIIFCVYNFVKSKKRKRLLREYSNDESVETLIARAKLVFKTKEDTVVLNIIKKQLKAGKNEFSYKENTVVIDGDSLICTIGKSGSRKRRLPKNKMRLISQLRIALLYVKTEL